MSKAFSLESAFAKAMDTVLLSILWLCCSIPVFTIGAASSALYYAYHKAVRQDQGHTCKTFFHAFRMNFKQATGIWLVVLLFVLSSVFTCYVLFGILTSYPMAGFLLMMGIVILCFAIVWCIYLFAYLARFRNKTSDVLKNSALLAVARMPWSLLLFLVFVTAFVIIAYKPSLCLAVIAIYIWLINKILERIFRDVMTEDERQSEMEMLS